LGQLVRASLLARLTAGAREVSDQVTRGNFVAVNARGAAGLDGVLRDLRADRDASYARLRRS
jgi:hypothetical protein